MNDSRRVLRRVLVATDGSTYGDAAVSYALLLARRYGSELQICYAVDDSAAIEASSSASGFFDPMPLVNALDDEGDAIVSSAVARAHAAGISAAGGTVTGSPVHAIVKAANDSNVDAIVLGTQGKTGLERVMMGSTADGVLRSSDVPVFVVSARVDASAASFDRILVALDDSDPSAAAAAFALSLAVSNPATLVFCGVADTRRLREASTTFGYDPTTIGTELRVATTTIVESQARRAREGAVAYETVVAEGDPVSEILEAADVHGAGCIVIGTHGRTAVGRLFFGSVAEGVVRRSMVPVAVVRAANDARSRDTPP